MKISQIYGLRFMEVVLSALISLLFCSSRLLAQEDYLLQLGPPPNGSTIPVELGFINLTNGNLHLEIPLGSFPQRGSLPFKASLVYDSRIWVPTNTSAVAAQITFRPFNFLGTPILPGAQAGWRLQLSTDPTFIPSYVADVELCDPDFFFQGQSWVGRSNFFWTEPNGTMHTFNNGGTVFTVQNLPPGVTPNCSTGDTEDTSGYADDGSGYFIVVTNYDQMTVYAPDGSQIATCANCSSGIPEDSNGNYFSLDSNGNVVDTLGRTPVITTTSGDQIYYDVLNAQGGRSRYTVTTGSINVSVPNYTTNLTVFKSITLPNGTSYQFGYEAGTTGDNWGGVNSVTLPTGGVITYGYSTYTAAAPANLFTNGLNFNSNRWVTSRTSGGGKWTYIPSVISNGNNVSCPGAAPVTQQNTVTKPDGSSIVYKFVDSSFASGFVTNETDYYGTASNLLKQELIGYDVPGFPCSVPPPIDPPLNWNVLLPTTFTTVLYNGSTTETTQRTYDYTNSPSSSKPTTMSEWDFYQGTAPKNPNRIIKDVYSITNSTDAAAHITGKLLSATLTDGSGNQIAQTVNTLDDTKLVQTDQCQSTSASQPSPAAPQHDYQNFCTSNTVRGNVTHITKWLNPPGANITTETNTYDDTGNLITSADAVSNTTKFEYSPNFGLAYVTKTTNAANEVTTKNYDFNTGLLTAVTDPNGQSTGLQTTFSYDNMGRSVEIDFPDGGQSTTCYSDQQGLTCSNGGAPLVITTTRLATPDPSLVVTSTLDGLGRKQTECLNDPQAGDGSEADCIDTTYDTNGRLASTSNPHRATAAPSDGITSYGYDGLDRTTQVTNADGGITTTTYTLRAIEMQDEGNGHAPVTKIEQKDAFGNVTAVCEVTSATQAGKNAPGACNLDIAATGFLTTYQYDLLNNLTGVQQSALSRSFTYDSLSRQLTSTNPESGTTAYTYDNNGNVLTRTRPAPNQTNPKTQVTTTYKYGPVNRLTQITYSDGSTPTVTRNYGTTSELGITLKNTLGHLSAEYVTDANNNVIAGSVFSYDPMGRITINSQCTPQNCPGSSAFPVTYSYDLYGNQTSATNGVGVTFNYAYDPAARLSTLTSSLSDSNHPGTLFSGAAYNPLGLLMASALGTSSTANSVSTTLNEALVWDCRGQLLGYASTVPPATPSLSPPNTPGCPNSTSFLNILPARPNVREPLFHAASLRGRNHEMNSVLLGRSATPHDDHGSIRLMLAPVDPRQGLDAIVVNYYQAETALEIAHRLAQAINAKSAYQTRATVRHAGENVFVDLSSEEDFFSTRFLPFVSVASDHKQPSVWATMLRRMYKAPPLYGQLRSAEPEAQ